MTNEHKINNKDITLWREVAKNFTPLDQSKRKDTKYHPKRVDLEKIEPTKPAPPLAKVTAEHYNPSNSQNRPTPSNELKPLEFNKSERRKFSPKKRLDLHGLREHEAFIKFSKFIQTSQELGIKELIVITGKKVTISPNGSISLEGVIRKAFTKWLELPQISKHIISYSPARPQDGGSGAFYLKIRTTPKIKR